MALTAGARLGHYTVSALLGEGGMRGMGTRPSMDTDRLTFWGIAYSAIVVHTTSYLVVGAVAFTILDYPTLFADARLQSLFRQADDRWVMAGPLFQPLRGLLFGAVFYVLRDAFFGPTDGWLRIWLVLVVVGILSTFGPAPSSIEGLIYTTIPARFQLGGSLVEVLVQSLLLSVGVFHWVTHPEKRWLTWALSGLFVIALVLPLLGLLMG